MLCSDAQMLHVCGHATTSSAASSIPPLAFRLVVVGFLSLLFEEQLFHAYSRASGDILYRPCGVDYVDVHTGLFQLPNHRHRVLAENGEAFLDALRMVVDTPAGFCAFRKPIHEHLLRALVVERQPYLGFLSDNLVPRPPVLLASREPVDKEEPLLLPFWLPTTTTAAAAAGAATLP
eukprot:CAMPEP_0170169858 /NCGR_PEP_ID=MMETSP0040_2-20121228/2792_1 /TAXON_ID=641309 /ORGANISM="Lotharella oceanica, Strain CCMP622" /LENGTH=176 /DNA_ID=CAMNT_0010408845 /DNA_START=40 /DNA_END=566 /DNA_ORIENTATION=+